MALAAAAHTKWQTDTLFTRGKFEATPDVSETTLKPLRLDSFIANLPCMAFQLAREPEGAFHFTYIGDGCHALLGIEPERLADSAQALLALIHPDDLSTWHDSMTRSAMQMAFWSWEGRVQLQDGEQKWLALGASPQARDNGKVEWEGLLVNVTQTKLDELELIRSQQQLREFSSHIQDVKEQERLRIAREVHDEIGGLLTAIKIDLAWMKEHLPKSKKVLTDKTTTIENLVDKAMAAARNLAHSLRPGYLDSFGIVAAIEMEADEFEQRTGIRCLLTHNEGEAELDLNPDISIALFRIFQEALTNIMKHARATQVDIDIHNAPEQVTLTIRDNGCGFSPDARSKPRSFGLRGIQERTVHFGGEVRLDSCPGKGTTITVTVPHGPSHNPDDPLSPQPQRSLF